jgi:hypothetical protein
MTGKAGLHQGIIIRKNLLSGNIGEISEKAKKSQESEKQFFRALSEFLPLSDISWNPYSTKQTGIPAPV